MTDTISQQAAIVAVRGTLLFGSQQSTIDAVKAISALPAVDGWQDIESAPKDGTLHLRWSEVFDFVVANEPPGCDAGLWVFFDGGWRGGSSNEAMGATHWQPLPTPPNP